MTPAETIATFSRCLFTDEDIVEVRRLDSCRSTWHAAKDLHLVADELTQENRTGQHIHISANPRRNSGGKASKDVAMCRCLFADLDKTTPDAAQKLLDSTRLPKPTLTVASGHGIHLYWRLAEPITELATWTRFQKDLIALLNSDPAIHDPARIMRLPGFTNHKAPPAPCEIVEADANRTYELAELHECIPERVGASTESPNGGTALPRKPATVDVFARVERYAATWEPASEGERNIAAYRHAAQLARGFNMSPEDAWPFLSQWNERNSPPLSEDELRGVITNGRQYGTEPVGQKQDRRNTAPPTDSLPPLPDPPWATIREVGQDERYKQGLVPITTGFAVLDKILGGFRPEVLYILAGRTGSAKSTIAANICRRVAVSGHKVLLFKLEESIHEATWRIHAAAAQVPLNTLLGGASRADDDERASLKDGWELIRDLPIRLSDVRDINAIRRISKAHAESGGELIVIDQLGMIDIPECEIGYARATAASNGLRLLARELHIPILAVTQVNRPASMKTQQLTCNDLRDSGALENDAGGVILVNGVRRSDGPRWSTDPLTLQILIGKNRYGRVTTAKDAPLELLWWPRMCRVEDAAPAYREVAE